MAKRRARKALFTYHQTVYSKRFGEGRILNINHYDESNDGRLMYYAVFDNADHQASIWYDINGKWFDDTRKISDYIQLTPIKPTSQVTVKTDVMFRKGDTVLSTKYGKGTVEDINSNKRDTVPVFVEFDNGDADFYTHDGKLFSEDTVVDIMLIDTVDQPTTKLDNTLVREPIELVEADYVKCSRNGYGVVSAVQTGISAAPYLIQFVDNSVSWYTRLGCESGHKDSTLTKITVDEFNEAITPVEPHVSKAYTVSNNVSGMPHENQIICDLSKLDPQIPNKLPCPHCTKVIDVKFENELSMDNRVWAFQQLLNGLSIISRSLTDQSYLKHHNNRLQLFRIDNKDKGVIINEAVLAQFTDWEIYTPPVLYESLSYRDALSAFAHGETILADYNNETGTLIRIDVGSLHFNASNGIPQILYPSELPENKLADMNWRRLVVRQNKEESNEK